MELNKTRALSRFNSCMEPSPVTREEPNGHQLQRLSHDDDLLLCFFLLQ
jgi:hypothetical protein